jgi:SAM-dependent methyltransferase
VIIAGAYEERRLKMIADLCVGHTVLDVGYAQQPNPYLSRFHRVGLDLNPPAADAKVHYEEEIVGDVAHLSSLCAGRTFDTIVCAELVEHLENPYALLRELRPLLADDGRLIVSTPNPLAFPVIFAELLRLKRFFYTRDHLYYFLPRWVARMFEATGYKLESTHPVGLWTPLVALPVVPTALSYQVIYVGKNASLTP